MVAIEDEDHVARDDLQMIALVEHVLFTDLGFVANTEQFLGSDLIDANPALVITKELFDIKSIAVGVFFCLKVVPFDLRALLLAKEYFCTGVGKLHRLVTFD